MHTRLPLFCHCWVAFFRCPALCSVICGSLSCGLPGLSSFCLVSFPPFVSFSSSICCLQTLFSVESTLLHLVLYLSFLTFCRHYSISFHISLSDVPSAPFYVSYSLSAILSQLFIALSLAPVFQNCHSLSSLILAFSLSCLLSAWPYVSFPELWPRAFPFCPLCFFLTPICSDPHGLLVKLSASFFPCLPLLLFSDSRIPFRTSLDRQLLSFPLSFASPFVLFRPLP